MIENNSLLRESVTSVKRHEVRPRGDKFMCYIWVLLNQINRIWKLNNTYKKKEI